MKNRTLPNTIYKLSLLLIFLSITCTQVEITISRPITPVPPTTTPRPTATPWPTFTPRPSPTPVATSTPEPPACPLPDLLVGQHLSASNSYTETQWSASGPMICRIDRDSCAYHQLVGLLEPTIIFKREEKTPYDTEDILMHPAMLTPLSRLNQLVLAEWGGAVQLRVTDAYDSLLEHDPNQTNPSRKYSLHFEGRAIDLTLWPIDRSRYGRLCALAHCAGFDWVHNEGTHCHASIRSKSLCLQCSE